MAPRDLQLSPTLSGQDWWVRIRTLWSFVPEGTALLPATHGPRLAEQLEDPNPSRIAWAKLFARVFLVDVTVCSTCGGPMRLIKTVTEPHEIATELHGGHAPPKPGPRLPGQLEMLHVPIHAPDDCRFSA